MQDTSFVCLLATVHMLCSPPQAAAASDRPAEDTQCKAIAIQQRIAVTHAACMLCMVKVWCIFGVQHGRDQKVPAAAAASSARPAIPAIRRSQH
jgi:hypothetical protein